MSITTIKMKGPSPRGISYVFGEDVVKYFCQKMNMNIELICMSTSGQLINIFNYSKSTCFSVDNRSIIRIRLILNYLCRKVNTFWGQYITLWSTEPAKPLNGWCYQKISLLSDTKILMYLRLRNFSESFFIFKIIQEGYEFFAQKKLVTIFSAPSGNNW